ncbi:MAG: peptidase dimerization domain-containing protein [Limisphaerales bacterium]
MSQLLGKLRDKNGKIAIPGFYDDVAPLSAYERKQFTRLPITAAELQKLTGVKQLFGERGFTPFEQRSARPTFEINGLTSGYQGEGSKTIVPAWARAKITCRLVPNQNPARIRKVVLAHLKKICPPDPCAWKLKPDTARKRITFHPPAKRRRRRYERCVAHSIANRVLLREGGSIPIVNDFQKVLGADTLLLGLGLPSDNAHSPNEKFSLDSFENGQRMSALLWQELPR